VHLAWGPHDRVSHHLRLGRLWLLLLLLWCWEEHACRAAWLRRVHQRLALHHACAWCHRLHACCLEMQQHLLLLQEHQRLLRVLLVRLLLGLRLLRLLLLPAQMRRRRAC
jgi:hypothetical protein